MKVGQAYQGCDFPVFFPKAKDATGADLDVTGATLKCAAIVGGVPYSASATSVDAAKGTSQAMFSKEQTANWAATTVRQRFDGVLVLANGLEFYIGWGEFIVSDPITPTP